MIELALSKLGVHCWSIYLWPENLCNFQQLSAKYHRGIFQRRGRYGLGSHFKACVPQLSFYFIHSTNLYGISALVLEIFKILRPKE